MDLTVLDNPAWHALNSHHQHLAIWGEIAVRYQPGILAGAALPEITLEGLNDLRRLVEIDETITLIDDIPADILNGWQHLWTGYIPQRVCEKLSPAPLVEAIPLTQGDVPEMLDLVTLTQPGPFLVRTIEMGHYFGVRQDGRLVAMAGERLHLPGFCEISAVCTHPDYRGRGYAGGLTTLVAQGILARGETPILSHVPDNHTASRLYEKLGFVKRTDIPLTTIKRLD